jgi:hypothetical protein
MSSLTYDNNNFTIITQDSPRVEQPDNISAKLFDHQLAMVYACHSKETYSTIVETEENINLSNLYTFYPETGIRTTNNFTLKSSVGVIADLVGSGKTFITMGIVNTPLRNKEESVIRHSLRSDYWQIEITPDAKPVESGIDVIVVPKSLFLQWDKVMKKHATFKFESVKNKLDLKKLHLVYPPDAPSDSPITFSWKEMAKKNRCILISCNQFTNVIEHGRSSNQNDKVVIDRLFYDEADIIKMSGFTNQSPYDYLCSWATIKFTWLVSSTIETILNQFQSRRGYKNILFNSISMLPNEIRKSIILRNDDKFIQDSFNIPQPIIETILCKNPRMANLLQGIVNVDIMNAIHAGDINNAINQYGGEQVSDDNALIASITTTMMDKCERYRSNIETLKRYIETTPDNPYHNESLATYRSRLTRNENDLKSTETRIKSLQERLSGSDTSCPICLDPVMNNKTVLKCCQNSMCFECFAQSVSVNRSCPICRNVIKSRNDAIVVSKVKTEHNPMNGPILKKKMDALNELLTKIKERDGGSVKKLLIYSEFSLYHILETVKENNISPIMLGGNVNSFYRQITVFKMNPTDQCLLLNAGSSGAGLNIQEATDIIMYHNMSEDITLQVIGRAQRFGRKGQLRVWRLANEQESTKMASVDRLLSIH